YNRWAVSIQNEISNKEELIRTAATTEERNALEGEVAVLITALAEKQSLAASSYATIAEINDQEALKGQEAVSGPEAEESDREIEIPAPEIAIVDEPEPA